jgi:hypothetical protein
MKGDVTKYTVASKFGYLRGDFCKERPFTKEKLHSSNTELGSRSGWVQEKFISAGCL